MADAPPPALPPDPDPEDPGDHRETQCGIGPLASDNLLIALLRLSGLDLPFGATDFFGGSTLSSYKQLCWNLLQACCNTYPLSSLEQRQ
jgi:hypothetical protein